MTGNKIVDHLFRHQYGKMVSILTHIFGLSNIELIEDAVQDTFIQAMLKWRKELPENPEAWLTKAAKNRAIDLLRHVKIHNNHFQKLPTGLSAIQLNDLFLDHEVEDSQLRMIFVACYPSLNPEEQIAFALKTISGFSTKEIASALLTKEETIKKRLSRARRTIAEQELTFDFPGPKELPQRLSRVMEVIYLTFNEGFHSTNKKILIREDLCGEAIRLCQLLLKKEQFRSGKLYSLFALMCFHASRLKTKVNSDNEIVDLEHQDRSLWYRPLIDLGNNAMDKATEYRREAYSSYHYEAAIAAEHLKATSFARTDWGKILYLYQQLDQLQQTDVNKLNIAIIFLQLKEFDHARQLLEEMNADSLEQRSYLYYSTYAEYFDQTAQPLSASAYLEMALDRVTNEYEKRYLQIKLKAVMKSLN